MSGEEIVIVGAGGHGAEVYSYLQDLAGFVRVIGVVDDYKPRGPWQGTEILGGFDQLRAFAAAQPRRMVHYITAVGSNPLRRRLVASLECLRLPNLVPWTLQHPRASVGQDVQIGEGTCLAPGSIVTTRVTIGRHCILNVNASVSHDCVVGDFTNINPGAVVCGNVRLGESCSIGAGATVIEKVTIGAHTIVGAGAVVTTDLPARVTAVGVPARVIRQSPELASR